MRRAGKILAGAAAVAVTIPAAYVGFEFGPSAYHFVENSLDKMPDRQSLPDEVTTANNSLFVCFEGFDRCGPSDSMMYMSRGGNRIEMPYEHFDPKLPHAIISVEDNYFNEDLGYVEYLRKVKAFLEGRGSSGIREQVARTTYVDEIPEGEVELCLPEIGCRIVPARKDYEWDLARVMQDEEAPEDTMHDYLNNTYLGCGAYGFEQAAWTYYGKSASSLTYGEAVRLASLAQSPSEYDGHDSDGKGGIEEDKAEYAASIARRDAELDDMMIPVTWFDGTKVAITAEQAAAAKKEIREFMPCTPPNTAPVAHYEVANALGARHALNQIEVDLIQNTGKSFLEYAQNNDGPVYVLTTIDYDVQAALNTAVTSSDYPRDGREAAVAAVTEGGAVAGMYGGPFNENAQVNLAVEPTSLGSAFKPWIYAGAMEAGLITNIDDPNQVPDELLPFVWEGGNSDGSDWIVENGAHCDVATECAVREALAKSSNIIPLQILENQGPAGLIAVDTLADEFKIESAIPPLPSMGTGSRAANMIDMTTGQFQLIGNGGASVERHYVDEVWQVLQDKDNNIYCWKCNAAGERQLVKVGTSDMLLDAMRGTITIGPTNPDDPNSDAGTAFYSLNQIANITDMAGKTGTYDDNKMAAFYGTFCVVQSENMSIGVIIRYPDEFRSLGDNYVGGGDPAEIWGAAVQSIKALNGNEEPCLING
ncbi:MAG: transglycosylase domain-containing protein [Candidatus Saccharibacteria bacterium]|nr:transglycosylase domain-containing protein [Candidatus Saccharibacteria bacterium]